MRVKTSFGTYDKCFLTVDKYAVNGSICLGITTLEEGYPEPLARLTVCLPTEPIYEDNQAYIDTNNCPWAIEFINKYKLGKEVGIYGQSGFCIYPLVEFDMDKIAEYEDIAE